MGNSLAVRLPATVVEVLELKEGDQIEIRVAGEREFDRRREDAIERACDDCGAPCPLASPLIEMQRMSDKVFFDTTILIYAISEGESPTSTQNAFS
jgi:antitoxin component of MazEF toxin-antitoxin module